MYVGVRLVLKDNYEYGFFRNLIFYRLLIVDQFTKLIMAFNNNGQGG